MNATEETLRSILLLDGFDLPVSAKGCINIAFRLFSVLLSAIFLVGKLAVYRKNANQHQKRVVHDESKATARRRKGPVCPFSKGTDFIVETAENLPPDPLDLYRSWLDPKSPEYGKPLAARWLEAGLSGQDTSGVIRAGLRRLRNSEHFLVQEPFRIREELLLKQKALDDPQRFPLVFAQEDDSIEAQRETLELFLSFLPRKYPDIYKYDETRNTLYVHPLDETFSIDEWMNARPLELCERIVQEDLILMRPPRETDGCESYRMAAAAVVFSFSDLAEKLGQPLAFIHAPIPGFEKHLLKTLNLTFSRILKSERPMWRNNWGIASNGNLDEPIFGSIDAAENRSFGDPTLENVLSKWLKVEYQTIRRLPRTDCLLFTVKTMVDRFDSLRQVPNAAQCLASSIRGMSKEMLEYKGIETDDVRDAILEYLDSISVDGNDK